MTPNFRNFFNFDTTIMFDTNNVLFSEGGAPMETPDISTLSDNIDSTDDLVPSLQVFVVPFWLR